MFSRFPILHDPEVVEMDGTEQVVPDGSDLETIGHINFVRMFFSGKLTFPNLRRHYFFGQEDLVEMNTLGSGSFGAVHRMKHQPTGIEMAVKKIPIHRTGMDEAGNNVSLKKLQKEVAAIEAASNCEHIVQFFGLTFYEGDAWVCMELMDISLEELYKEVFKLGDEMFNEDTIGMVAISTISALNHMKDQHHIIHRDVKPSNILINRTGVVKLCDFGICGYLVDSVAQTRDAGCRPYMAPERLSHSSRSYDIRADVWSLGISLVEIAKGEFPYPGFSEAPLFRQLQMVVYADPPIVDSIYYTSQTRNFINSCLIKDKNARPTFTDLMNTPYYHHYSSMPQLQENVARYVTTVLVETKRIQPDAPSTSEAMNTE